MMWSVTGKDRYGKYVVSSTPEEIAVRWEESVQQSQNATDNVVSKPCTVYVDRAVLIGSILRLGTLENLPTPLTDLREVTSYKEVPDLKGRNVQRTVTVTRYNEQLPEAT
jgi:hypothetical protein